MRHNQNAGRMRGGRSGGGARSHNSGGHHHQSSGQQPSSRRVNPRIQTFDSNGPDVRIRGTAYQINEKYVTLARDAASAGDRVLAESYLQHAEHYQRFINEMTEEFNQYNQQNPQQQPQPQMQPQMQQPQMDGAMMQPSPEAAVLNDLDQGFLVGPRHGGNGADAPQPSLDEGRNKEPLMPHGEQSRHRSGERHSSPRRNEPESA